jgi:hypothetical protein
MNTPKSTNLLVREINLENETVFWSTLRRLRGVGFTTLDKWKKAMKGRREVDRYYYSNVVNQGAATDALANEVEVPLQKFCVLGTIPKTFSSVSAFYPAIATSILLTSAMKERERARRESVRGVSQVQADDELRVDLVWDAESGVTGTALLVVAFLSLFGVVVIAAEETVS